MQLNQWFIAYYYKNTFADSEEPNFEKTVSLKMLWAYMLGPWFGGILAGLWKHYDARVKARMDIPDGHPYHSKPI